MIDVIAAGELFTLSYVVLWLLLLLNSLAVLLLFRHFGLISMSSVEGIQRDGLPIGEKARAFRAVTASGAEFSWKPPDGERSLLLFAAPGCKPCQDVFPYVKHIARSRAPLHVAAVVPGPADAAQTLAEAFAPSFPVLAEDGSDIFADYRTRVTPFAFVIGEDGRIRGKGLVNNAIRLDHLLRVSGCEDVADELEPLTLHDAEEARKGAHGREEVRR